jgi:hypothetical protein
MTKEFWIAKMMPFLIPIKAVKKLGGEAYGVMEKTEMIFLFEGGFKVSGEKDNISIHFTDPDLLILMTGPNPVKIYRIPYHRLIGFELIRDSEGKTMEDSIQFLRN